MSLIFSYFPKKARNPGIFIHDWDIQQSRCRGFTHDFFEIIMILIEIKNRTVMSVYAD